MPLVIRDTNAPPPERYHYPVQHAEGIVVVDASNYNALFDNIRKHCAANGIQGPSDQEVIDYLCRETHLSCYDSDTRVPLVNKLTQGLPFTAPSCCNRAK